MYRYGLTYHDLGINHDSFVVQLLDQGIQSKNPDELTEEQGQYLGAWLRDLYDSDKEGLSNEVFASCRPQDFYLIVPTLFSQTVMACSAEVLSLETVKGGLECMFPAILRYRQTNSFPLDLHETFLLPSLIGGLSWMASHALKQTHNDLDVLMQLFNKLIRSAPTSGDAAAMHQTVMAIVSSRLEKCFRTLKRRHPSRTDIDPLLEANKSNLQYERSIYPSYSELEQWTNAPNNTLVTSLRHTVQQLSQWSLQPNPPSYTHRQIYASMKLLGSSKTLNAIVDEVKAQTELQNGAAALDVAVSLICAPLIENSGFVVDITAPAPPRTRMSLREMLKVECDNAASVITKDPLRAETVVRLHRRVEAQLVAMSQAVIPSAQIDLPNASLMDVQNQTSTGNAELDKALNDAAAATIAAASGNVDLQPDSEALQRSLDQHLDLAAAGGGLDLSSMGVGVGVGVGAAGAADINMNMSTDMGTLPDLDLGDMSGMGGMMDMGDADDSTLR